VIAIALAVFVAMFANDDAGGANVYLTPLVEDHHDAAGRSPTPRIRGPPSDRCELPGRRLQ
jgi:hypothetical protein